jgi:hypothetical protein
VPIGHTSALAFGKRQEVSANLGVVETEEKFGMRQRLAKRAKGRVNGDFSTFDAKG